MSNQILLRWAENENCDGTSDKVGKELCPPKFSDKVKDSQTSIILNKIYILIG